MVEKIKNVSEVRTNEDSYYYRNKLVLFKAGYEIIKFENNLFGTFYLSDKHIIIQHYTGKIDYFDLEGNYVKSKNGFFNYLAQNESLYLDTESNSVRSLNDPSAEFNFENNGYIFDDYYLINHSGQIKCYSYSGNTLLWQFETKGIGLYQNAWQEDKEHQVKKFLGVWNEQLIVQLTGGKFIGLELKTGEFLWSMNEVKHNLTKQEIDFGFSEPDNPFLDEVTGRIYMLQGEVLIEFDLIELEATYAWSIRDLDLETYPFIRQSKMHNGKIYFTARSHVNNDDDMVGIFDLEENRVIWQHIFEFERGTFIPYSQENIHVNSRNLLVLDNKGLLHIFEK